MVLCKKCGEMLNDGVCYQCMENSQEKQEPVAVAHKAPKKKRVPKKKKVAKKKEDSDEVKKLKAQLAKLEKEKKSSGVKPEEEEEEIVKMPSFVINAPAGALKVSDVGHSPDGSCVLSFEDERFDPIALKPGYFSQHDPVAGGYYVVYPDGYKSFCPGSAFKQFFRALSGE